MGYPDTNRQNGAETIAATTPSDARRSSTAIEKVTKAVITDGQPKTTMVQW